MSFLCSCRIFCVCLCCPRMKVHQTCIMWSLIVIRRFQTLSFLFCHLIDASLAKRSSWCTLITIIDYKYYIIFESPLPTIIQEKKGKKVKLGDSRLVFFLPFLFIGRCYRKCLREPRVLKSSLVHLFFFPYHLKPPLPFDFTYFFYVICIGFPLPFIDIMDECKQGNMSHTCMFNGFFWEYIFWNNF